MSPVNITLGASGMDRVPPHFLNHFPSPPAEPRAFKLWYNRACLACHPDIGGDGALFTVRHYLCSGIAVKFDDVSRS